MVALVDASFSVGVLLRRQHAVVKMVSRRLILIMSGNGFICSLMIV